MKTLIACLVVVAMTIGGVKWPLAQCDYWSFIEIISLRGVQITVGWPLGANIQYWVDPSIPSGIVGDYVSAVPTWDGICNQVSFTQVFLQHLTPNHVKPVYANWVGPDSAAAGTVHATKPTLSYFHVLINFQNFPTTNPNHWSTGSATPPANKLSSRTVALHEIGHAVGLSDGGATCTAAVMKGKVARGQSTIALSSDETAAAQALYNCQPGRFYAAIPNGGTCIPDFDPAADVADFRVSNGVVTWTVLHEWQTREYILEGCETTSGEGTELFVDAPSLGRHTVTLGETPFSYIRLVEVERSGKRKVRAYDIVRSAIEVPRNPSRSLSSRLPTARPEPPYAHKSPMASVHMPRETLSGNPTIVVYSLPELVSAVVSDVVPFWEVQGHLVEVVDVEAEFPSGTELEGIKASIANYSSTGTKYFHLVGDWEDDYPLNLWASDAYWQSKYDAYRQLGIIPVPGDGATSGIPTFRAPDHERGPSNTATTVPYVYTDQWYADTDNDDVPDVIVTRWPFSDPGKVIAAAGRLPLAHTVSHSTQRALLLVGEALSNGPGSIEVTRAMAGEVQNRLLELNQGALSLTMLQSDYPDDAGRNYGTAWALNFLNPDLVVGLATYSNEYWPCEFFVKEACTDPPSPPGWRMESLDPGFFTRLVLAASCHSAEWASPTYICDPNGPDFPIEVVCEEFLANDGAGALAWIGPTTGSLQGGNYAVATFVVEELMANPYRPMAESWLVAMQRAYAEASAEYIPTLMSYTFLGDPLSPYRRLPDRSITAKLRRTDSSEAATPATFAVGCPQGDRDKLVVEVSLDAVDVLAELSADAFTLSQPVNGSVTFFPEGAQILADSATSLVVQTAQHRTTFTVSSFSGCGVDSALVSLYGIPLGYAHFNVKSYDVNTGENTHGVVNLPDLAVFGGAYPSSRCNCVYAKDYVPCVDYAMPDTTVNLIDFAEWWPHYNHETPGGGSSPEAVSETAAGTVLIEFEEIHPLIGEHKLRAQVSLEGVEPFELAVFALHNASPKLEFLGWTEAGDLERETLCIEAIRDGRKEVVIGVLGKEGQPASATTLGTAEFRVLSDQQLVLSDEDLALVTADLLSTGSQRALAVSSMDVRRAVALAAYENALAQNYPNPFNPTTTISFSLARSANASLSIYDVRGSLVRRLVDERKDRGIHRVVWDGMNSSGQRVASGVYFYKLIAGSFTDTKKMTTLK